MKIGRPWTLVAGLVLIGVTNAVAIAGALYNRAGEPDSTLDLSERELWKPGSWFRDTENSGLALELIWRVIPADPKNDSIWRYHGHAIPAWLDEDKMSEFGFEVRPSRDNEQEPHDTRYRRQLPREVLIVLELDGPAYAEARAYATTQAEAERKSPGSRLFAVDAGLDRGTLRSRYPDRSRYAIVAGTVRPTTSLGAKLVTGYIEGLSVKRINVPLEFRDGLVGLSPVHHPRSFTETERFQASLAFGKRLEPWLISVTSLSTGGTEKLESERRR